MLADFVAGCKGHTDVKGGWVAWFEITRERPIYMHFRADFEESLKYGLSSWEVRIEGVRLSASNITQS